MSNELLYLIFVLIPNLSAFTTFLSIFSGILLVASFIAYVPTFIDKERFPEDFALVKKLVKFSSCVFIVFSLLFVSLPTSDQLKFIIGAKITTNVEGVEKLPENTVKFLNGWLEKMTPNQNQKKE